MEDKERHRLDYLPTTPDKKVNSNIRVGQYTIRKGANPLHYATAVKTARQAKVEARKKYDGAVPDAIKGKAEGIHRSPNEMICVLGLICAHCLG